MTQGQKAIQLLNEKIERTRRVLPPGRTVTVDAESICMDLERIVAQVEALQPDSSAA